jgi:hypothetical protein
VRLYRLNGGFRPVFPTKPIIALSPSKVNAFLIINRPTKFFLFARTPATDGQHPTLAGQTLEPKSKTGRLKSVKKPLQNENTAPQKRCLPEVFP